MHLKEFQKEQFKKQQKQLVKLKSSQEPHYGIVKRQLQMEKIYIGLDNLKKY